MLYHSKCRRPYKQKGPDTYVIFYAAALSATLSRSLSPGSVMVMTLEQ
jgi:hypothetical protein